MKNTTQQDYLNSLDAMFCETPYLEKLAKPLFKHIGLIDYSCYFIFSNAEVLHLSCLPQLDARLAQDSLEQGERFSIINYLEYLPNQRYILMDSDQMFTYGYGELFCKLNIEYDCREDFVSVDKIQTSRGEALRLVEYCSPLEGPDINGFYLNSLELIERINTHITIELAPIIDKIPLIKPTKKEYHKLQKYLQPPSTIKPDPIASIIAETGMHFPKYNQLANIRLSKREKEVIHWYLLGKTTNQTADILQISHYTVRTYFESLKNKLGVYFKPQLLLKLIDGEFIKPDDWKDIY